jgi:hypothetical protein
MRFLLGWIPFSVGDVLIGLSIGAAIWWLVKGFRTWRAGRATRKGTLTRAANLLYVLLTGYLLFHWLWGLNYYRLGSAAIFQMNTAEYSTADVDTLVSMLHKRLTVICADSAGLEALKTNDRRRLGAEAMQAWEVAAQRYPFMTFRQQSLKPNMLGPLQSYTGYGGYLFPFTGEAQVDFYVPAFVLPFTVCHEMAHQQGFGSESEANMVGFLAARASKNPLFVYSAYSDMHGYALRELYRRDTLLASAWKERIPGILAKDRRQLAAYYQERRNPAQPLLDWVYNRYLLNTNQPEGIQSYNRVVAWLIAYGKKYGWNAI